MSQDRPRGQKSGKVLIPLAIQLIVGLGLAYLTYAALNVFKGTAESEIFGWLSISGAGVGSSVALIGLLAFVLGADILWLIFFLLWLLKKKMHLDNPDNTLHLP